MPWRVQRRAERPFEAGGGRVPGRQETFPRGRAPSESGTKPEWALPKDTHPRHGLKAGADKWRPWLTGEKGINPRVPK